MEEDVKKNMQMEMENIVQSMKKMKDMAGKMPGMEEMKAMMGRLENMANDMRDRMMEM